MGKKLTEEDKLVVLKFLKKGYTSEQCANAMGVSVPTISNLRALFKREGETFPNNRGRKKLSAKNVSLSVKKERVDDSASINLNEYDYLINGIKIKFSGQPKTVRIGKNRFYVEF